jgi:hypothetical protein
LGWGRVRKNGSEDPPLQGRSEVAGSVLHGAFGKREYVGLFDTFAGEGLAFLAPGDDTTSVVSVLFTVDPLKQDVEQEVTAKNAKRQKNCDGHIGLPRTDTNGFQAKERVNAETPKNPEGFMRNSLGDFSGKGTRNT